MRSQKQEKAFMHVPAPPELDTPEKLAFPQAVLKQLRETTPVRFDESRQVWDVFRYHDAVRVLQDAETFSSNLSMIGSDTATLATSPPSRHGAFRGLVERAFTLKAVQNFAPRMEDIVDELLGAVELQNRMNLVRDFAGPLPVIVIAELLGVPSSERMFFKEMSDSMVNGVDVIAGETYEAALQRTTHARFTLIEYFQSILDQRKVEPQDDLISKVWLENVKEQVLTEEEVVYFCVNLLIAGNKSTSSLIGHGVEFMATMPHIEERLHQDPSLIPSFIEETLRFQPSFMMMPRRAAFDVELRGQKIRHNDMVMVWLATSNRDPDVFPNPDEFIIDRSPNNHLAFGKGMHFCLGAPLARMEARVAFEGLLKRFKNFRATGEPVHRIAPPIMGAEEYPIFFDKK